MVKGRRELGADCGGQQDELGGCVVDGLCYQGGNHQGGAQAAGACHEGERKGNGLRIGLVRGKQ